MEKCFVLYIWLKDAWEYILNSVDEDLTIVYIKKIHLEVCKGQNVTPLGEFRDSGVRITGTSWRSKLPSECNYGKELEKLIKFYETDDMRELKLWLYDCVGGVE